MLELAVGTFLAIQFEPCLSEIFEEVAGGTKHGDEHRTSDFAKASPGQVERPTSNIEGKSMG